MEIHGFPWEIDLQKVDFPYLCSFTGRYIPTCQAWSNWDARTVGGFDVAGWIRHGMAVHSRRHWHRRRLFSGSVQFVPRSSSTSAGTVRGYSVDKLTSLLPSSVWRNTKRSMWRMSMLEQAWQPWQLRCKLIKLDLLESSIHKGCPDSYSQDGTMPRLTGAPHMPRSELVPCWDSESPKLQSFEKSSIFSKRSTRPFFGPPPFGGSPAEISLDRAIVRQHLVELIKGDLQRGLQGSHTESWGINQPPKVNPFNNRWLVSKPLLIGVYIYLYVCCTNHTWLECWKEWMCQNISESGRCHSVTRWLPLLGFRNGTICMQTHRQTPSFEDFNTMKAAALRYKLLPVHLATAISVTVCHLRGAGESSRTFHTSVGRLFQKPYHAGDHHHWSRDEHKTF